MTTMKQLLYIAIITALPMQSFAGLFCSTEYKTGGNPTDCLATDRCWPDGNSVYFCGTTSNGCCAGVCNGNTKHTISYGGSVNWNGSNYYCCGNATANSLGYFVQKDKWMETRTQTKTFPGGGTCTYTQTKTACDTEWRGTECTSPCKNPGETYRNGECVKPCELPLVFESKTSNRCVECETTPYQKATDYGSAGVLYCLRCDPETQFVKTELQTPTLLQNSRSNNWIGNSVINAMNRAITQTAMIQPTVVVRCAAKSEFDSHSKQDIHKCWRCNGPENFEKCMKGETPHKFCPESYTGN